MYIRIFCSKSVENLITDEVEFLGDHKESHDTEDSPGRLVIYHFDKCIIEECNKFFGTTNTVESITDKFLLFLIKALKGYNVQFNSGHDPNLTEIEIN